VAFVQYFGRVVWKYTDGYRNGHSDFVFSEIKISVIMCSGKSNLHIFGKSERGRRLFLHPEISAKI
jgi:hypothetical protein